jgi:hypothetical protein
MFGRMVRTLRGLRKREVEKVGGFFFMDLPTIGISDFLIAVANHIPQGDLQRIARRVPRCPHPTAPRGSTLQR